MLERDAVERCWGEILGEMLGRDARQRCLERMLGKDAEERCWTEMLDRDAGQRCGAIRMASPMEVLCIQIQS